MNVLKRLSTTVLALGVLLSGGALATKTDVAANAVGFENSASSMGHVVRDTNGYVLAIQ